MQYIWLAVILICAYLIGSISTAILFGKLAKGEDIRAYGSGNAGATNALRTFGKGAAAVVTIGDCVKAVVAILLAMLVAHLAGLDETGRQLAVYTAGIGAVLGHNFPVYFKFRGGKGVLVSMVAILFANWWIGLLVVAFALAVMAVTRYVSLGSVLGAVALVVLACIFENDDLPYLIFTVLLAASAVFMHRENINRLLHGTERKLGEKKEASHGED